MRVIGDWSVASVVRSLLGFARFWLAVAMVVPVIATAVVLFVGPPGLTTTVPVSYTVENPSPVHGGRPGFGFQIEAREQPASDSRVDHVEGSVRLREASRAFVVANGVVLLMILWLVRFAIDQLRAVLGTVIEGNPFDPANGHRIRRIAFAVIAGEFVRAGVVHAANLYATTHVAVVGVRFDGWPRLSVWTLMYGLLILVIAEVFRVGTRLNEEQSLTI